MDMKFSTTACIKTTEKEDFIQNWQFSLHFVPADGIKHSKPTRLKWF